MSNNAANMTFADKVSAVRIVLIPIFVSLLIYSRTYHQLKYAALAVFVLAVLSDFFDGLVARIKKEKSDLGQIIDPVADKLLLLTSFIALYILRGSLPLKFEMPLGLVIVAVSRDLIILVGAIVLHILKIEMPIEPSIYGKLTTFFQMFTIFCLLVELSVFPFFWPVTIVVTLASGVDYFMRGVKALNGRSNQAGS